MPLVSETIRNLIGGVSQQATALRLPTQAEASDNTYPSVVDGLSVRPTTKHVARLSPIVWAGGVTAHVINRDVNERYVVLLRDGGIEVYDLDGNEKTVNATNLSYLNAASPKTAFRAVTIADHTFIVNTEQTVGMTAETTPAAGGEALVFVKQGDYSTSYSIHIDGTLAAEYATSATDASTISTNEIAKQLAASLNTSLGSAWTISRKGHVIHISHNFGTPFDITVYDDRSDRNMRVITDKVQRFSDLPTAAPEGFRTRVVGDSSSNWDDYYVEFAPNSTTPAGDAGSDWAEGVVFDNGVWVETAGFGLSVALDATTMPHILRREADGTFTFEPAEWDKRAAGDDDSAPLPTFVGRKINDLFFFKNRLGILSDENCILSSAGKYHNWFLTTVSTILADDPIDVAANSSRVSILRRAVALGENILFFSEQGQFTFDEMTTALAQDTAEIVPLTEYEANTLAAPVASGNSIFFATANGSRHSGIREFVFLEDTSAGSATDVTAHVPRYIPNGVTKLAAAANAEVLAVITSGDPSALYLYKYFWSGEEKVQSAWQRATFDPTAEIVSAEFIIDDLVLVINRADGTYLETMSFASSRLDEHADWEFVMDRKVTEADCSVSYDLATDTTEWTLPYTPTATTLVVTRPDSPQTVHPGQVLETVSIVGDRVTVSGDYTTTEVFIGHRVTMRHEFSPQYLHEEGREGGQALVSGGRLQMLHWILEYNDTGYFRVEVEPEGRDKSSYALTHPQIGASSLNIPHLQRGEFRFPVLSRNDRVKITVINDTHLPCNLLSAEWKARYTPPSRRL